MALDEQKCVRMRTEYGTESSCVSNASQVFCSEGRRLHACEHWLRDGGVDAI